MRNNIEALERNLNDASEMRLVLQTLENFIRPPRRGGAPSPVNSDIELGAAGVVGYETQAFTFALSSRGLRQALLCGSCLPRAVYIDLRGSHLVSPAASAWWPAS